MLETQGENAAVEDSREDSSLQAHTNKLLCVSAVHVFAVYSDRSCIILHLLSKMIHRCSPTH